MNTLDIVFKILNFIIFAAIIGYYFYTRLLKNIYAQISAKNSVYTEMSLQTRQEQDKLKNLNKELIEQETCYHTLQSKIALWRIALSKREEARLKEEAALYELLRKNIELKKKNQILCYQAQHIFPRILNDTVHALQNEFAEKDCQAAYNDKIIDALESIYSKKSLTTLDSSQEQGV